MQVHQYISNGYRMILDVPSGSVHVGDALLYDAVEALADDVAAYCSGNPSHVEAGGEAGRATTPASASGEGTSFLTEDAFAGILTAAKERFRASHNLPKGDEEDEVDEVFAELHQLFREGSLFSPEPYRPSVERFANRPTVVKALCLHVAHDCNLACRYCFAEEGEYHGRRAIMPLSVGKAALDFLAANSGTRKNLEVDFFGGEPLLNFNVVKELVAYGRQIEEKTKDGPAPKQFRFTLTTNGVLLNEEVMEFCNREMHNVVLSIDGRKEVHDRMRPFRKGQGSYDLILPKLLRFAKLRREAGLSYYVRGTFTRWNLDFARDVLHLADLGFDQISVEPVVAPPTEDYALRKEDIPALKEQYDILAREMILRKKEGRAFNFFHFMIDLSGGPCVYKRLSGCGSGTEYLAVTPWGDFYPCHQFVGTESFLLGNVTDGIVRKDIVQEFKKVNVYSKEACANCFARFYCSGGCAANSYNFTGGINDVYEIGCELQRKRVECALMLKAAEAEMES